MEKDLGSWFYHRRTDWQAPNLNSSAALDLGAQITVPAYANPCANMFLTNGTPFPHSKPCQPNEPHGWFYCLPRFRQAFSPLPNSVPREKLPAGIIQNRKGDEVSSLGTGPAQKRFIVFDRSGDRTTFIFSSRIGGPVQYPPLDPLNYPSSNLKKDEPETKGETFCPFGPFLSGEYNQENQKDDVGSEMQEDSEEIDALLYSDDDFDEDNDYSEDDDVMSTGHSPSMVTAHGKEEWTEESGEDVGSSGGPTKRQKLSNGGYSVPSFVDTASSVKSGRCCFEYVGDAESCCGESKAQVWRELESLSGKKRSRKAKIQETLSILESIVPGGSDGKDAIGVIDEAIRYLRSLKVRAKALGFGPLSDDASVPCD
ncbi:hypothetical protein LguiA_006470 [Lonicera macranthoides]